MWFTVIFRTVKDQKSIYSCLTQLGVSKLFSYSYKPLLHYFFKKILHHSMEQKNFPITALFTIIDPPCIIKDLFLKISEKKLALK